jgi:nucleoside-diphosphate-sugar epimerase
MPVHLVVGGSGYFGNILVQYLKDKGITVRVFDINGNIDRPDGVEFVQGDIRDTRQTAIACQDVEVLYNCVAQVPLARDRKLLYSVNVDGTQNLFESASIGKVRKIIHISTSAVFGVPDKNPIDETVVPKPVEPYGAAKFKAEKIAHQYIKNGLDITIIRPRTILGHKRLGIFSVLFDWVHEGANIPVLGSGENRYQFVHAEDLAEACFLSAKRKGSATYNIGTEHFGTMRQLLEDLVVHAGTKSKVKSLPFGLTVAMMKVTSVIGWTPFAPYHWLMYGREMFFDLTKARSELGWRPHYSNAEMICESYDWYCRELHSKSTGGKSLHQQPVKQGLLKILKKIL